MANTYWLKQTSQPLFPDLLWSRPQNKRAQGKLLIIGGHQHSFAAVSQAYSAAIEAGIGSCRAVLPASLEKSLGKVFPEAEFAAANPSGGFAHNALAHFLDASAWADGVLMAGDFGNNSETTVLLESYVEKYPGPLTAAGDSPLEAAVKKANAVVVSDINSLQKTAAGLGVIVRVADDLAQLVEKLADFSKYISAAIITEHQDFILTAYQGRVCTTAGSMAGPRASAYAAVWHIQQPSRTLEAAATAVFDGLHPERI